MSIKNLRLTDAMKYYEKEFKGGVLNIVNAPPACGKTTFIFNEFLNNTSKYNNKYKENYKDKLSKVLYVCDTTMLKDSVLAENEDRIEILTRDVVINQEKAIKIYTTNKIKVMTYSTLGWFLGNAKSSIVDRFDIIVADEIHNLFKYCTRYNTKQNDEGKREIVEGDYAKVIESLYELCKKKLFIAMTGTPNYIHVFNKMYCKRKFNTRTIFSDSERNNLFTYNFDPTYVGCIFSDIKSFNWKEIIDKTGYKIFIYTKTIRQSEKYKKWFEMNGLKAEWLCSIHNMTENLILDETTGREILESTPTMTDYKIAIRNRLLKGVDDNGDLKGTVPDDLDVLIVNGGYETGWNLYDDRFQFAFIDTTDEDEQRQSRYRIRNDIKFLRCLNKMYDKDGIVLTYDQYGNEIPMEVSVGKFKYRYEYIHEPKMRELDNKYLGVKLTSELKEEIKFLYGVKGLFDKEVTWNTIKRDLKKNGYIVKTSSRDTYIFKEGQETKKDSKRVTNKMDKLIRFLKENESKRLTEKQKEKLIGLVDARNAKGELLKTISKINKQIDIYEIGFIILSKSDRNGRWWQIESIAEE